MYGEGQKRDVGACRTSFETPAGRAPQDEVSGNRVCSGVILPAIDGHGRAGEEAGLVCSQEHHGARNFLGLAEAIDRICGKMLFSSTASGTACTISVLM